DERSGETAERLSNQNHVTPLPDRLDDDVGVLLETRADIIAWQLNSDRIRPSPLQAGCHSMRLPRHSPRATAQNVRGSCLIAPPAHGGGPLTYFGLRNLNRKRSVLSTVLKTMSA